MISAYFWNSRGDVTQDKIKPANSTLINISLLISFAIIKTCFVVVPKIPSTVNRVNNSSRGNGRETLASLNNHAAGSA